ncbi:hypothetical protein [Ancylobacter sp. TS-1]|uniref:hypothetical protein n=1 Tax=Ancylobacter sp. TS-1 TaxID=1850374 RepID=UPI00139202EA|nr:hypothetical protein [Ancylobacter sp. TS-1]
MPGAILSRSGYGVGTGDSPGVPEGTCAAGTTDGSAARSIEAAAAAADAAVAARNPHPCPSGAAGCPASTVPALYAHYGSATAADTTAAATILRADTTASAANAPAAAAAAYA